MGLVGVRVSRDGVSGDGSEWSEGMGVGVSGDGSEWG